MILLVFSMLAVVFIRLDSSITPAMVPVSNIGPLVLPLRNQLEMTTPDYYDDYKDAMSDGVDGADGPVGGIDHLLNVTNNLTNLVGQVNVNQAFFKEYVNILRKKTVPVDLMEVVRITFLFIVSRNT